ncbi:ribonuclease P protein component [Treponema sp. OMZ 788]|uniref:ribonuclease P protein component n=1 Tax=unclassified Treponema TaxID=2638727 RepID=UPI0020A33750|nr:MULTISPECIES: ribonuclease P protein component [unclassified Treponema]UTC63202.1 ribonuclease P protein component [Treponema sp. OMZ 787]UTC63961.1 ribonuclease P protein component [Treponema sp. OMZ 788]
MSDFTFSGEERLRDRSCIKAVFKKGLKLSLKGVSLFILPNGLQYNRFLCTFRRGFGSAVMRNRSRRISKEAYRHIKNRLKPGNDFILLVFSDKDSYSLRLEQLTALFSEAKMYNNEAL